MEFEVHNQLMIETNSFPEPTRSQSPEPTCHQDTELWNLLNSQFPESKILGLTVSRCMRGLVDMASEDKVDVDTFHKGIQYALEKLGKSNLALKEQQYQILKAKDTRALGTSLLIIPELRVLC